MDNKTDIYFFLNTGNDCYLISALQVLLLNNTFKQFINNNELGSQGPIIDITRNIINNQIIHEIQNYKFHRISNIHSLKYELSLKNNFFKNYGQQDSQECLLYLIEEYAKIIKNNYTRQRLDYHEKYYNKQDLLKYDKYLEKYDQVYGKSIINEIFIGTYNILKKCNKCSKDTSDFEPFFNIDVIPQKSCILSQCILDYFNIEEVELTCEVCKHNTHKKKVSIMTFPNTLMIFIKRYNLETFNAEVMIDQELKITSNDKKFTYKLNSVVHHIGNNMNGGHYYISHNDFLINDDKFNHIDRFKMLSNSKSAYIVIYDLM